MWGSLLDQLNDSIGAVSTSTVEPVEWARAEPGDRLPHLLHDDSGQEYYVRLPEGHSNEAPVFIAIHDSSRDAETQANAFSAVCERYGAILIAPRFAADRYPNYQRLGRSRHPLDQEKRADDALDSIVEVELIEFRC